MPFDHSGRWHKKFPSIMNPGGDKITFPQLVAEFVVYWRVELMKDYQNIKCGNGWYLPIQSQVRHLNQQSHTICNYFPHPDDEPLVVPAFKNVFRRLRPLTIGGFRKTRQTKNGKLNITQAEKDIIVAIECELERLIGQRDVFKDVVKEVIKQDDKVVFSTDRPKNNFKTPMSIINLERKN